MKPKMVVAFTLALLMLYVPIASGRSMALYEKGYNIANFVEESDLVVYGKVVEKEFLLRPGRSRMLSCTTDITIEVRKMIKGAPNAGDDHVKFTLEGGRCDTGAVFVGEPEFELKEWVVLFLVKSARPHIPADGYTVFRFDEGKRPCTRNRVPILTLNGIKDNVHAIIFTDGGDWKLVTQPTDPSNVPIIGGQAFMLYAQQAAMVEISGEGWDNTSAMAAAPPVGEVDLHSSLTGIQVTDTTSVLGLKGSIVNEEMGLHKGGFRVTVKNLSTGRAATAVTGSDETDYRLIMVDIETGRAATVGTVLEISAQSTNPFIGVQPLQYTVTAEDVKQSLIQLPNLTAYDIPAETQLLANYPNPFNPETWIPYRLAEDAFVTLTIYDGTGRVVGTIDVGHQVAAVYESRSKAVYWNGRNNLGEQVASGVYFYHLSAGDYSATRKMLILK